MGKAAAEKAAEILKNTLKKKKKAYIVMATGASQFEFLESLRLQDIDWNRIIMFHLDEYLGIPDTHPASFRYYLKERFVQHVNFSIVNFINGDAPDFSLECDRLNALISTIKIDLALLGIGENGHLAFNDPPADFYTIKPYIVVDLDEKCRQQQVGEGWFKSINKVPNKAISMSINEILRAKKIICVCPDKRKAQAVRDCLSEDAKISPNHPASALKQHKEVYCYLDKESSSYL